MHNNHLFCVLFDKKCTLRRKVSCINIQTGGILWEFSVENFPNYLNGAFSEEEANIKKIIGVYHDILWIHVGGFILVGIEIETGKMVHKINNVLGDSENNFLDIGNGLLKTLSYNYYAEFDLQTLQFKKQTIVESDANITIGANSFYEGEPCLYFCGYYNNSYIPNVLGIFDSLKTEIVWHDTIKESLGNLYSPPQVNDKWLIILDDEKNLLVYERGNI